MIRFGLAEMPSGVSWGQIHGSAILAGVGFTMSLYVSGLAFPSEQLVGFSNAWPVRLFAPQLVTTFCGRR